MSSVGNRESTYKVSLQPGAEFHERIAVNWTAGYMRGSFKRRLTVFTKILDRVVSPGQIWLDLGCGSGVLTLELLKRGASVVALDGAPAMIDNARATISSFNGSAGVTFRLGDAQDLSWSSSAAFDGVLCSSVIEYVSSPDALMSEISRVLKESGLAVLSLPPTFAVLRVFQKLMRRAYACFGQDKFAYLAVSRFEGNPSKLELWFAAHRLSCERITRFDPILPAAMTAVVRPALLIYELRRSRSDLVADTETTS
jgi:ubiquinone/menaquinone biosynthesis C-methylase UbiE